MQTTTFVRVCLLLCWTLLYPGDAQPSHHTIVQPTDLGTRVKALESLVQQLNASLTQVKHNSNKVPLSPAISFYAYSTHTQHVYPHQTFLFDYVETNVGNGFSANTGKFTSPVRGLYYFAANIMPDPGYYFHVEIVKNGRRVSSLFANAYMTGNAVLNLVMEKGDEIWVRQESNYESRSVVSRTYAMFSGYLISTNV